APACSSRTTPTPPAPLTGSSSSRPAGSPGTAHPPRRPWSASSRRRWPVPEPLTDPVLALLLDPTWLSGTIGRPVRVTRVRTKPGVTHAAALLPAPSATKRAFVTDIHSPDAPAPAP